MKALLILGFTTFFFTHLAFSKTTRVSGELTGAGSKFSIVKLVGFIYDRNDLPKEKVEDIHLNADAKNKELSQVKISEIKSVTTKSGVEIEAHQFDGFIVSE